jgi:hypothetical protein
MRGWRWHRRGGGPGYRFGHSGRTEFAPPSYAKLRVVVAMARLSGASCIPPLRPVASAMSFLYARTANPSGFGNECRHTASLRTATGARPEAALRAVRVGDEHLARDHMRHLVDPIVPIEPARRARPGDHHGGAVGAARELAGARLRRPLDDPTRVDGRGIERDGCGIGEDDLHGGPRVVQMVFAGRDLRSRSAPRIAIRQFESR